MHLAAIANIRLITQQIAAPKFKKASQLVSWMGVLQAQDYNMAKWAIGIRLPKATQKTVEAAIHKSEIIRTHVLRPTWHFVSAEDIYWMLTLSAPKIKARLKTRHRQLGLTTAILNKSNTVIEKALTQKGHLTRKELVTEFKNAKIAVDENRSSHLLLWAELEGLICSGCLKNTEPTYALFNEWVPKKKTLSKEESLAELARKYFNSHGPATLRDFVWWSGLTITEARQGLEMVKDDFISEKIEDQQYWLSRFTVLPVKNQSAVYLLPAFDEYIIGYTNRAAILPAENQKKAISNNGIFRPAIIVNGKAAGIWSRTTKKDKIIIEITLFEAPAKTTKKLVQQAAAMYGHFIGQKTEIA